MSRYKTPTIFFSFRSPFSWMALHVLRREFPDYTTRFDMVPFFEPDPDSARELAARGGAFHYVAMSKAKHLYILNDTKRLARRMGLTLSWPVDVDPRWDLPHLAWLRARELGCDEALYDAITQARWERGENICEEQVLLSVLDAAELPAGELVDAAADPRIRALGVDALMQLYRDDVFGVPYFRVGRDKFWGLDRVQDFITAYRDGSPTATAPPPESVLAAVGAFDHDTAGGCG